jgi:xylulokinase
MDDDILLLGIDVGTTNCKAVVFDRAGQPRAAAAAPTPVRRPRPSWVEHEPELLWQTVVRVVRAALRQVDPARVRGLAVACMAEAGLLLDAAGRPLTPIISWNDSRSDPQYRRWLDRFGINTFIPICGNAPNPIFGMFKLLWLSEQAPDVYARAARWLHVSDYIAFGLCGAQATDYSLATRTMLLDLPGLRWSDTLLAAAGLRADLLPELAIAGTCIGGVAPAAARATGLLPGVAVGLGAHDHVCGALAAGAFTAGVMVDSVGTAEQTLLPITAAELPQTAAPPLCAFGAHAAPGMYYASKGIRSSGAAVAWANKLLGFGGEPARMQAAAAKAPAGSRGVLFLPRLAPIDRGAFVGITAAAGPAELARAVYEGLAYEWRANLERVERAVGARAGDVRLIGGGGRVAVWVQIKADLLGRPLHVLDIEESVALGAALLGGVAAGVYRDQAEAVAGLRLGLAAVAADAEPAAYFDRYFHEVFLKLAPALAEVHAAIGVLEDGYSAAEVPL